MKVSVIVTVYNGKEYICETIESTLNQTYEDLEIIIMDDASTDETPVIIEKRFGKYFGDKIIYHRNEKNMERVYSRNKGVEIAKGSYIFFLDYDDIWKEDYVESVIPYLEEYDIVYSFPRTFIDEKGKVIRKSRKKIPDSIEEIIFSSLIGYPSATAVKKESFVGYKDRYILREDWEFYLRSYFSGKKIKILDNDKVLIRDHGKRTSRNTEFMVSTLKVYEDYVGKIPRKYLPYFEFHVGDLCLRFGNLLTGWKLVLSAFSRRPDFITDNRKVLSVLKRGFRFDRALRFSNSN